MAKYTIEHTCGHEQAHQIAGPIKGRESKEQWLKTTVCGECYAAQKRAEKAAENKAAATKNEDLVPLTGSEKQIAWAESIRAGLVPELVKRRDHYVAQAKAGAPDKDIDGLAAAFNDVINQPSAGWWIDNRIMDVTGRVTTILKEWAAANGVV